MSQILPVILGSDISKSTRSLLLDVWDHLSRRRHVQLGLLLIVMLVSGLAELVSLGSVLPFLAVLTEPKNLWDQPLVNYLAGRVGYTNPYQLFMPATLIFAAATVLASIIRLFNLWLNGRIAASVGSDLSCEAFRRTLSQPYKFHIQRNTAEVITGSTTHISGTVTALTSLLQLITGVIVVSFLLLGLLLINWAVSLGLVCLFGSAYLLLAFASRKELDRNSRRYSLAAKQQIKSLQEGLGAIREVLLNGNQNTYLEIYERADRLQRLLLAKSQFLGAFPRYLIEALAMLALALIGGGLAIHQGDGSAILPLLGAFGLGAQRLLPALQQVYSNWSRIKSLNTDLAEVLFMLNQKLPIHPGAFEPMQLKGGIVFDKVYFRYCSGEPQVLLGLDLTIKSGECIGLIGKTGSGKSTAVDILMGLLEPSGGKVFVDGQDLYDSMYPERLASWRASVAHVPQTIFLSDSTISENVAFGVPPDQIDQERVEWACEQAHISKFIESVADGYYHLVGERGISLSGGQRQRIGIARALYKNAHILILDEATSALDSATEASIINGFDSLRKQLTVVMVAHRLSTLKHCSRIFQMESGCVDKIFSPKDILHT